MKKHSSVTGPSRIQRQRVNQEPHTQRRACSLSAALPSCSWLGTQNSGILLMELLSVDFFFKVNRKPWHITRDLMKWQLLFNCLIVILPLSPIPPDTKCPSLYTSFFHSQQSCNPLMSNHRGEITPLLIFTHLS